MAVRITLALPRDRAGIDALARSEAEAARVARLADDLESIGLAYLDGDGRIAAYLYYRELPYRPGYRVDALGGGLGPAAALVGRLLANLALVAAESGRPAQLDFATPEDDTAALIAMRAAGVKAVAILRGDDLDLIEFRAVAMPAAAATLSRTA